MGLWILIQAGIKVKPLNHVSKRGGGGGGGGGGHWRHYNWGFLQSIFRPANYKRLMPVSRKPKSDSPETTRLGLCGSLDQAERCNRWNTITLRGLTQHFTAMLFTATGRPLRLNWYIAILNLYISMYFIYLNWHVQRHFHAKEDWNLYCAVEHRKHPGVRTHLWYFKVSMQKIMFKKLSSSNQWHLKLADKFHIFKCKCYN